MSSTSPAATTPNATPRRKLIEVSLPLEAINEESAHEKSVPRRGHPATMHLWWARRPLAAARAVLFAQLVDDPSSFPDRFPTEEAQRRERDRLHGIIRRLVKWEHTTDESLFREAHAEILKSTGGKPPAILDPFAGGGTIPLEAQRLGLEAHGSDLNPVAVLITKALVEIPPKFADRPPVFPGAADSRIGAWPRATGMADDVRRYAAWINERASERIGHLYPKATLPDGTTATVIAWLWARTLVCPNPACGIEMPLVRTWWLAKAKGKETYIVPSVVVDATAPSGRRVEYTIGHGATAAPADDGDGTVGRTGATCVACGSAVDLKHVRAEARAGRMGTHLTTVIAEGVRRRIYLPPSEQHLEAARVRRPDDAPTGDLPASALGFRVQAYGMTHWADLFSNRQLTALTTFGRLTTEVRQQVLADAVVSGWDSGKALSAGGTDGTAYADAVATYLSFALSKLADWSSSLCSWICGVEKVRDTFARQALPMVWDYLEINPFSDSVGNYLAHTGWVADGLDTVPAPSGSGASVTQTDAASRDYSNFLVATDPPYYDNIGYSDLSDYFYIWLRAALRDVHPDLFDTLLVPKADELVANPFRHGGREAASRFFEQGFAQVFGRARETASSDYPITVFYAFKQAELESEGVASTGWSTFLEGMIREGWTITATWPVRSERSGRMISVGTNALASSIVLALRPRNTTAAATDRSGFLAALHQELVRALPTIRQGSIAPADLRQTVLGPGMAVFSRFSRVLEDDGSPMSVKNALGLINQAFDGIENEQDAELDPDTRFCLDWIKSYAWSTRPFGDAEKLAVPLGLSVAGIARGGVISSGANKVALVKPLDLDSKWNPATDDRLSLWEATCHLARVYATEGREGAARLVPGIALKVDLDGVKRLATRLYELMESKDAATAGLFNGLGGAWSDVAQTASTIRPALVQGGFDFEGYEG